MISPVFVGVAFLFQLLLLGDFLVRWWRPGVEQRYSQPIYGLFIVVGLVGGAAIVWAREPLNLWAGPILLLAWAIFGFVVDGTLQIPWRSPPLWSVFVPYVILYVLALFAFWMPLLEANRALGMAYGALLLLHTLLNVGSHFRPLHPA